MNAVAYDYLKYFILISIAIYFIYYYLDEKKIKDEPEEFLKLKTFELVQKMTLFTVTFVSVIYFFYPSLPAFVPIILIVICSMYAEIIGKAYLRSKF